MTGTSTPTGAGHSDEALELGWRLLIEELGDQLDQWAAYLHDPSADSLPIGGLPPMPTGPVPANWTTEVAQIMDRVRVLTEQLERRSDVVSEEIERVRKTRTAAVAYAS